MAEAKTFSDFDIDVPPGRDEAYVICPRCSRDRKKKNVKCLWVGRDEGIWHCYHCGRGGSLKNGWSDEAPDEYRRRQATIIDEPRPLKPPDNRSDEEKAMTYLAENRKIPEEFLCDQGVQVVKGYCWKCEEWRTCIAVPYMKGGKHVHTKYKDGLKHFWTDYRTLRCLYGYDLVVTTDEELLAQPVIITEGEFDALALRYAGFPRVVSVPDGAPNKDDKDVSGKFKWLDDAALSMALMSAPSVILAVDEDENGERLQDELGRRIGYERCSRVTFPAGIKDANEALVEIGVEGLRDIINQAEPYPVEGMVIPGQLSHQVWNFYENGMPTGISTGWTSLDGYIKFLLGQFVVVHGPPGMGKSHWLNALLTNFDLPCAICSPEWQPIALHMVSFAETYIGKPFAGDYRMKPEELSAALQWMDDRVTFIMPQDRRIETVLDRARIAVARRGIRVLVIDPWTEILHDRSGDQLAYIQWAITKMRDFGAFTETLVILAVHPAKPPRNTDDDGNVVYLPQGIYGPSGSSDFANKADVEIELLRNHKSNEVSVYIQKVRLRFLGKPGMAKLYFDKSTGRYSDSQSEPHRPNRPEPGFVVPFDSGDLIDASAAYYDPDART